VPSSDDLNYLASKTEMTRAQIKKWLKNHHIRSLKVKKNYNHEQLLKLFFIKNQYPSEKDMQQLMRTTLHSKKKISQWFRHKRLKKN
jgi:hypothetical protein